MRKIIVANFKSNKTVAESAEWLRTVLKNTTDLSEQNPSVFPEIVVAPSFVALAQMSGILDKSAVLSLAAQDISPFPAGSYTGAVGVRNIAELGLTHVILGHSERRRYFGETSASTAQKAEVCVEHGLQPVICIDAPYLDEQLSLLSDGVAQRCIFAYEPLEAIGSGNNAPVSQVVSVIDAIRKNISTAKVLYGGSVTENSIGEYLLVADGALVGGASLDAEQFVSVVGAAVPAL